MKISVIGTGYVGLVTGTCLAEVGNDVLCLDVDVNKINILKQGGIPIYEPGLEDMVKRNVAAGRLRFTTDVAASAKHGAIQFIAVGTPPDEDGSADLQYVVAAARAIGQNMQEYKVIVDKSTVPVGTADKVRAAVQEELNKRGEQLEFSIASNPEFLKEGAAVDDFMRPDRIVLGGIDERSIEVQRRVYAPFDKTPTMVTNNKTAELIKYTSNSVLATLISFSNEIGNLCSALGGVDVADVMRGVHMARYFTSTLEDGRHVKAPITSFLWAGCGYGGSCLPKDTQALSAHGAAHGTPMPLMDAVIATNLAQPARLVAKLQSHFPSLDGVRVALLGLAFKEGTDDMRESPSAPIARSLVEQGAKLTAYDPIAMPAARAILPPSVTYANSLEEVLHEADAAVLVTRWDEFQRVPQLLAGRANAPIVIDGRRVLEPASVARYDGIGR